jgi:hypothetical protein
MNKYIWVLAAALVWMGCKSKQHAGDGSSRGKKPADCARFKDGTFRLTDKVVGTSYVIRNGDMQLEVVEGRTDTSSFYVRWLDECTYVLTPTQSTFDKYGFLPANAQLTVTIINTKANAYVQTSVSNFADMKITNEMVRIE